MAKASESINTTQLKSELEAGIENISRNQVVSFQKYTRAVLPIDGYVFWVKDTATAAISVQGSLHYSTDQQQRDDETIGINKVVFTTQQEIENFNNVSDNVAWIGTKDNIRFSFTARGSVYDNAGTYHYRGDAIYPAMYSQIIDNPGSPINLGSLISVNSMPLWLALSQYMTLYPAMLLPSNIAPPYAAIDISDTKVLQAAPSIGSDSTSNQLCSEKVKITIYGLRNDTAIDFHNYILNYSLNYDTFGIMNMPTIREEKRGQSELGILAQKKVIEYEISYNQYRAATTARQLILHALPQYIFNE